MCALLVVAAGCDYSETIRQNGLVPRPRVDSYDGQPMTHAFAVEGHAQGTLASASEGTDETSGATVARYEVGGALHFAAGRDGEVAVLFDDALRDGATNTNNTNPVGPPTSNSFGFGASVRRSVPLGDPHDPEAWRLGINGTFQFWSIARQEEGGVEATDLSALASLSIVPSKRVGNIVLFGSGTISNQIGVPASYVYATGNEQGTSPATSTGGAVGILGVGARFEVADGVSFVMQLSQTIGMQGSDLPMLGAALILAPGRRRDAPMVYVAPPPQPMVQPMYPPPSGAVYPYPRTAPPPPPPPPQPAPPPSEPPPVPDYPPPQ
jgi:hypothetical protein